ncbi:adenylate/guanylate cyclase domain-containing protein [Nocardioides mangrovicus]|uniref:Adenylate/guanylate cyclase domain-containing protein n=1 Tax=Nocardioides mangrovicus TaxID=2478913 RepID=A0A3L8P097_9ACTN|nr:adenylate/guanylate cyclase domain-containing protein [Nocardioides mangrovicus]
MAAPPPDPGELLEAVEALLLGGPPELTRAQVAERAGVELATATSLWHLLGFPESADDEPVFTEADVTALRQAAQLIDAGILDEQSQNALVRTWGRSFARLAEWQVRLLAGIAVDAEDPGRRLEELALDVVPVVEELQAYIWRRHQLAATTRLLMRPAADAERLAVGFVDIVGYTSRSKTMEDGELVDLVEHFEDVATSATTDHGGRIVKTIGDEVLFVADDPAAAAELALDLVGRSEADEAFPQVRAGVAYGAVVERLGDVFGPTVNIASRLTSVARPGSVLVDQGMHEVLEGEAYQLHRTRRVSVKGYRHLEPWRLRARDR